MSLHDNILPAEQFDDLEQQTEAARLGMWTFLATEILLFGGLFTGYTLYRWSHPEAFATGSELLDVTLGGINTVVLIASSLAMALGVHASRERKAGRSSLFLVATAVLGALFLAIKFYEYGEKFHEGLVPGANFHAPVPAPAPPSLELFFSFYFTMTGLHALHLAIGIAIVLLYAALLFHRRRAPDRMNMNAVEMVGLYWHLVDIVWIFLFPLLYLVARHG